MLSRIILTVFFSLLPINVAHAAQSASSACSSSSAAASSSSSSSAVIVALGDLNSCFPLDTITVPGPARYYVPVGGVKVAKPRTIYTRRGAIQTSPLVTHIKTKKVFRFGIGFVEGTDKTLTHAVAQPVTGRYLNEAETPFVRNLDSAIVQEATKQVIGQDVTQIAAAKEIALKLFRYEATDDKPTIVPYDMHYRFKLNTSSGMPHCLLPLLSDVTAYLEDDKAYRNCAVIVPPSLLPLLHDMRWCDLSEKTVAEQVAALKAYAALLCKDAKESHEAPIMTVDPEVCTAYLQARLSRE